MQRDPDARIQARDGRLEWGEDTFEYLTVKDPSELLWDEMDVDLVIEASGLFTNKDDASKHLDAGADRVLITAPAKGGVVTLCPGVNEDIYDPEEHRMVKVLAWYDNEWGYARRVVDLARQVAERTYAGVTSFNWTIPRIHV